MYIRDTFIVLQWSQQETKQHVSAQPNTASQYICHSPSTISTAKMCQVHRIKSKAPAPQRFLQQVNVLF